MRISNDILFPLLGTCACLLALACGDDSATTGAGGTGGNSGGEGGVGASGGDPSTGGMGGDPTTGGMGGVGGVGGVGGIGGGPPMHPGVLVDDGLVVRYYMDEATTGQMPTELLDSAPNPMNLDIGYVTGMDYVSDTAGQTGIYWDADGLDGRPTKTADGSKIIAQIHTSPTATAEMVVDVKDVNGSNSRLLFIGTGTNTGRFTISTFSHESLTFTINEADVLRVAVDITVLGRIVLHAVLDTSAVLAEDRARFYINGGRLPAYLNLEPTGAISLGAGEQFAIGNRQSGGRSIEGTIYYTALYDEALTDQQILENTLLLLDNDDTPMDTTSLK